MIDNKCLKDMVVDSFADAVRNTTTSEKFLNNSTKSAYFVASLGKKIAEHYTGDGFGHHFQDVTAFGQKVKGEWLLDIAISKQLTVEEDIKRRSSRKINIGLEWAIESEYATSLSALCDDLGKLLCVNSDNYLYLNGINQKDPEPFIEARKGTVLKILRESNFKGNLYYGFWPSPEKRGGFRSIWEETQLKLSEPKTIAAIETGKLIGDYNQLSVQLFKYTQGGFEAIV